MQCGTPKRQNTQTPEHPNARAPKCQNTQTPERPNTRTPEQKKKGRTTLSALNHPPINLICADTMKAEKAEKKMKKTVMMTIDKASLLSATSSHTDDELIKKSLFYYIINLYV